MVDSRQGIFSLRHLVHTWYGAHSSFSPMGTGGKAIGTWSWLLNFF